MTFAPDALVGSPFTRTLAVRVVGIALVAALAVAAAAARPDMLGATERQVTLSPACQGSPAGDSATAVADCPSRNATETAPATPSRGDPLELVLGALAAGVLVGAAALAAWDTARRRLGRRLVTSTPAAYWVCTACRSLNPIDRARCYHCHERRPADVASIPGHETPMWTQRFGHPWSGEDEAIDGRSGPRRD